MSDYDDNDNFDIDSPYDPELYDKFIELTHLLDEDNNLGRLIEHAKKVGIIICLPHEIVSYYEIYNPPKSFDFNDIPF